MLRRINIRTGGDQDAETISARRPSVSGTYPPEHELLTPDFPHANSSWLLIYKFGAPQFSMGKRCMGAANYRLNRDSQDYGIFMMK